MRLSGATGNAADLGRPDSRGAERGPPRPATRSRSSICKQRRGRSRGAVGADDRQARHGDPAGLVSAHRRALRPDRRDRSLRRRQAIELARNGRAVAVNIAGPSLTDREPDRAGCGGRSGRGMDPQLLSFELTETTGVANIDAARRFATSLENLGCDLALDDFGTGLSSLGYLKHIPIQTLKIDTRVHPRHRRQRIRPLPGADDRRPRTTTRTEDGRRGRRGRGHPDHGKDVRSRLRAGLPARRTSSDRFRWSTRGRVLRAGHDLRCCRRRIGGLANQLRSSPVRLPFERYEVRTYGAGAILVQADVLAADGGQWDDYLNNSPGSFLALMPPAREDAHPRSGGGSQVTRCAPVDVGYAVIDVPSTRERPLTEPDQRPIAPRAIAVGVRATHAQWAMEADRLRDRSTTAGTSLFIHPATVPSDADGKCLRQPTPKNAHVIPAERLLRSPPTDKTTPAVRIKAEAICWRDGRLPNSQLSSDGEGDSDPRVS